MYDYGLIGNCQVSGLISKTGSLDWLCMPRPDSEPIFAKLLDPHGGQFVISPMEEASSGVQYFQNYIANTNILQTQVHLADGTVYRITDFCPRFEQHGRIYRPLAIFRMVEPLSGSPLIHVSCSPVEGWSKTPAKMTQGNSHLRFDLREGELRLTTNMPLTYLNAGTPFALKEKLYFALTWGIGIEDNLIQVSEQFLDNTASYWRTWVKHCSIPALYQKETIRSALTLKLHCYEDTGAILAALTTSLPEEQGGGRNWDYRFCWLRDAYFALTAFHNLGHFEEMEGFLKFLLNIAHKLSEPGARVQPVYTLTQELPLPERIHENWAGYKSNSPIRSNNQAAEHIQNDAYGEMVLTLSPIFFDERFNYLRTREHEELLSKLAKFCAQSISQPDAGLWEIRNGWQEHSFTNLMCWAGLERIQRIQESGYLKDLALDVKKEKLRAEQSLLRAVVDGSLRNSPMDATYDASLAQLPLVRFPYDDINKKTLDDIIAMLALENNAQKPSFFYRYMRNDDFGKPKSAFVVCSFWIAQALVRTGRLKEAEQLMTQVMSGANHLGLFAEHFLPEERLQLGNFPQAYSHVGQINAAFAISPPWQEIL